MNKKDIRNAIFDQVDWDPSPTQEAVNRIDRFVARAIQQISLDAPFLFFDDVVRFTTQPDVDPIDASDTLVVMTSDDPAVAAANPWVFMTSQVAGTASCTTWATDRSWDGRWLEITDAAGVKHQTQIRSVYLQEADGKAFFADKYIITVSRPWAITANGIGPFVWRVYTPTYWLPDEVIEIKSLQIVGQPRPIEIIGQAEAEQAGLTDQAQPGNGMPAFAFRREHFQLPGPNVAPALSQSAPSAHGEGEPVTDPDDCWKGPEPAGKFQYRFTYAWGKRDFDYQALGMGYWGAQIAEYVETDPALGALPMSDWAQNRMREPLWESAPSPYAETEIVTVDPDTAVVYPYINVLLPNIEYQLGFGSSGLANNVAFRRYNASHSGVHIRIYRRRVTEDFDSYSAFGAAGFDGVEIEGLHKLDIHDDFLLLAEMRVDEHNEGTFRDDGTIIPDYNRPLRDVHGYQSLRLWPMPDARYEVEVRCVRRPRALASENDVPPIHAEACELVISYARSLTYEYLKDFASAGTSMAFYREQLETLRRRFGDARPPNTPTRKQHATPAGYNRPTTRWWKRSSTP